MNSTKVLATFSKNSILNTSFINQLLNNEYNTITRTRSYFLLIFLFYFMSMFEFCRLICFDYFIVNLIIYLLFIICMHFFSVFSFSSYILFFFFFFLFFLFMRMFIKARYHIAFNQVSQLLWIHKQQTVFWKWIFDQEKCSFFFFFS